MATFTLKIINLCTSEKFGRFQKISRKSESRAGPNPSESFIYTNRKKNRFPILVSVLGESVSPELIPKPVNYLGAVVQIPGIRRNQMEWGESVSLFSTSTCK